MVLFGLRPHRLRHLGMDSDMSAKAAMTKQLFSLFLLTCLLAACGPKTAPDPQSALTIAPGYLGTLDDETRAGVTILEERQLTDGVAVLYEWPTSPTAYRLAATYVVPEGDGWAPSVSAMIIYTDDDEFNAIYTSEETRRTTLVFGRAPAGTSVQILWHDETIQTVTPENGYFLTVRAGALPVVQVDLLAEDGEPITSRFFAVPTIAPSDQG